MGVVVRVGARWACSGCGRGGSAARAGGGARARAARSRGGAGALLASVVLTV